MEDTTLDPKTFKGPKGPLKHRCPKCSATGAKLLKCGACRAVRYCSAEHQVAHRPEHKAVCNKIKKARTKLAKEDHKVRNQEEDWMTPANAFETDVGRFWGIVETRDYMRARFAVADYLLKLGTLDGVTEALEHLRDMMRLCRKDNMGLRDVAPALMLRLDQDQECYDFIKWWATGDPDGHYDWGDMSLPHLNLVGEDVFEEPTWLTGAFPDLNHLVAILILKLKLVVDICSIKKTRKVLAQRQPPLPAELWQPIELDAIRSPLSVTLQKQDPKTLDATEHKLLLQIRIIGAAINKANQHFMFYLFDPDESLSDRPGAYSMGSHEEMALALQNAYAAFWENEGVFDLLNDARACASRDSETEIAEDYDEMISERPNDTRTKEEMLSDVSINRMWYYLEYAIENASYLGPWADRPSERHTKESQEAYDRAVKEDEEFEAYSDDGEDD